MSVRMRQSRAYLFNRYFGIGQYVRLMDLPLLIWLNLWNPA